MTQKVNVVTEEEHIGSESTVLEVQSAQDLRQYIATFLLLEYVTEEDLWDHYWTLENEGTQEFGGPQQVEKVLTDKQVWDKFNKTIERREDGMEARDLHGDAAYLTRLLINPNTTVEHIEAELKVVLNEIRQQVNVSKNMRGHFEFLQEGKPLKTAGAGENSPTDETQAFSK
ncbi:hypothetical protein GCK32_005088 [Trichostrongylus colubriformis]|uniref:Uncharacterized protein n=1 Tax=Trichostrongylus colubriformis TaxID=6319 RepID=A0AAN8FFC6_TRICO